MGAERLTALDEIEFGALSVDVGRHQEYEPSEYERAPVGSRAQSRRYERTAVSAAAGREPKAREPLQPIEIRFRVVGMTDKRFPGRGTTA
jgi:hypothetical protein